MFSKLLAGLAFACLLLLAAVVVVGSFIADPAGMTVAGAVIALILLFAYRARVAAVLLAGVGLTLMLSGCTGFAAATPEQAATLVTALAQAGCSGSLDVSAGAATGQLGGSVHAENTFHGQCDPSKAKAPVGAQVGQLVAAAAGPAAPASTTP